MSDALKILAALLGLIGFVLLLRAFMGRLSGSGPEEPAQPVFPDKATPDIPIAEVDASHEDLWDGYFRGQGGLVAASHGLDQETRHWREKLAERLELLFCEGDQEERGPELTLGDVRPGLLEALGGRIGTVRGFEAGYAALAALDDPNVRLSDLSRIIMANPILSGKVLRCVNSAYFGLRGEVNSLPMAILILGMTNMRNIIYRENLAQLVDIEDHRLRAFFDLLWEHLALTSVCCTHVAKAFSGVDAGTLFTMGLLHDIGRFVIATSPLVDRDEDQTLAYDHRFTIWDENELFGINHALAGRLIADKWRFPRMVALGLEHHHAPAWTDSLSLGLGGEELRHLTALYLADKISGVFSLQEEHSEPLHYSYHSLVNRKALAGTLLDPALARDIKKAQEMALRVAREKI